MCLARVPGRARNARRHEETQAKSADMHGSGWGDEVHGSEASAELLLYDDDDENFTKKFTHLLLETPSSSVTAPSPAPAPASMLRSTPRHPSPPLPSRRHRSPPLTYSYAAARLATPNIRLEDFASIKHVDPAPGRPPVHTGTAGVGVSVSVATGLNSANKRVAAVAAELLTRDGARSPDARRGTRGGGNDATGVVTSGPGVSSGPSGGRGGGGGDLEAGAQGRAGRGEGRRSHYGVTGGDGGRGDGVHERQKVKRGDSSDDLVLVARRQPTSGRRDGKPLEMKTDWQEPYTIHRKPRGSPALCLTVYTLNPEPRTRNPES